MLGVNLSLINAAAVVLALSLSANGLLALALINARRHWFLRTAVYLAILSLLLVIPAPELVLMFGLQAALITAFVAWKAKRVRRNAEQQASPAALPQSARFTLHTLLCVTALVAYGAAVYAEFPDDLNWQALQSFGVVAAAGAVATFLGRSLARRQGKRLALTAIAFFIACLPLALITANGDYLLSSLYMTGWPPDPGVPNWLSPDAPTWFPLQWWGILVWCLATAWITGAGLPLVVSGWQASVERSARPRRMLRAIATMTLIMGHAVPLAWLWVRMAFPPPIPVVELPTPNGWDDLVRLGPAASKSPLNGRRLDYVTASQAALQAELANSQELLAALHAAIDKPLLVPVDYKNFESNNAQAWRSECRLLAAEAREAQLAGRHADAVQACLRVYRLGAAGRRGGLLLDGLVGIAVTGIALEQLYEIRVEIPDPAQLADELLSQWKAMEPYEEFHRRDKVWSMYANGWFGRLLTILEDWNGPSYSFTFFGEELSGDFYRRPWLNEEAKTKLLVLELLAIDYRRRSGSPPQTVADLLGGRSLDDFRDPLDPEAGTLRMKSLTDGVLFYSVGANGVDDDGAEPDDSDGSMWFTAADDTGDMRLDLIFGKQLPAADGEEADDGSAASNDEQTAAPLDPPASSATPN